MSESILSPYGFRYVQANAPTEIERMALHACDLARQLGRLEAKPLPEPERTPATSVVPPPTKEDFINAKNGERKREILKKIKVILDRCDPSNDNLILMWGTSEEENVSYAEVRELTKDE